MEKTIIRQYSLFTLSSILDLDLGLVSLIEKSFLNENVFDINFFNRDSYLILKDIINRKDKNPLYIMAKSNIDKSELDDYYNQFLNLKELLYESFFTNLYNLVLLSNSDDVINPYILYLNDNEKEFIENNDELKNISHISLEEFKSSKINFDFIFIKDLDEIQYFSDLSNRIFYLSKLKYNFDENNNINLNNKYYNDLIAAEKNNKFAIYDLYNL